MRRVAIGILALFVFAMLTSPGLGQQSKAQRPSPAASTECKFTDGKSVTINYSSPRMRGRKIFGELVPFGQVWRAGANEATTFVTDSDLIVGGKPVPAGKYTLHTIPAESKWTLIISKKSGGWGIPYPGEAEDFTRTEMMVSKLPEPLENFTITLKGTGGACGLSMEWETTRAAVEIGQKK